MPVTTSNVTKEATAFISSDKKALYLPTDMPAFQLDFTQYYYPGPVGSPGDNNYLACILNNNSPQSGEANIYHYSLTLR